MIKLQSLKNHLPKSMQDQKGASAIEYAVLVGMVALIIIAVFSTDGSLNDALEAALGKVATAITPGDGG